MRVFTSVPEAILEIRRDLMKSPEIVSTRVQNKTKLNVTGREALAYSYSIPHMAVPATAIEMVKIGANHFSFWDTHQEEICQWMANELHHRMEPELPVTEDPEGGGFYPDKLHPRLREVMEGAGFSYEYRTRLQGMVPSVTSTLINNPDSRRAYWSIFQPLDGQRAMLPTRIPCSLGYHFLIREVPGHGARLHVTYVQRSADFDSFWLSDLWFASQMQYLIWSSIRNNTASSEAQLCLGQISHIILSFHTFNTHEEIY